MFNIAKKALLTGIGFALIAREEIEDLAKDIVKKGKMPEEEGLRFIEDLRKRYDTTQKTLEDKIQQAVKKFMKKADVVTREELKGLKKEIRELKKAIAKEADSANK